MAQHYLGMPDIELLRLPSIMCKILDQQQVGGIFASQMREISGTPEDIPNTTNINSAGATNNLIDMLDYFRSSEKRETDKEASRILTKKMCDDFSHIFTSIHYFKTHSCCR